MSPDPMTFASLHSHHTSTQIHKLRHVRLHHRDQLMFHPHHELQDLVRRPFLVRVKPEFQLSSTNYSSYFILNWVAIGRTAA